MDGSDLWDGIRTQFGQGRVVGYVATRDEDLDRLEATGDG